MSHNDLAIPQSFETILDQIETLNRQHLLLYRLGLGRLLLDNFWAGDARAFSDRDRTKELRFELFFAKEEIALARLGVSRRQARDSIRAAIVVGTLPKALAEQLLLSQILLLTRLGDPTLRARVAKLALSQDWSVAEMRDAVDAARAGLPLDGDAVAPGVQPPAAPAPRKPAPGRLVTRAEKLATEVEQWAGHWADVETTKLRPVQRERLRVAVERLEAQVVALRRGL